MAVAAWSASTAFSVGDVRRDQRFRNHRIVLPLHNLLGVSSDSGVNSEP